MQKKFGIALLVVSLFASVAWAFPSRYFVRSYTGAAGATPTLPPVTACNLCVNGDGMTLTNVVAYKVRVCSDSGNLSGAGTLQMYDYDPDTNVWARNPGLDLTVTVSGSPCQTFPGFSGDSRFGGVAAVPNGVTFSVGTTGTVKITACAKNNDTEACR